MDESSLKALIESLQNSRDSLNFWLDACSLLVVIGVIAEIVFVFRVYHEELLEWRRGIVRPADKPSKFWLWMELAGVFLVSIGVAGEFWVDVKAGDLDTKIRDANSKLVLFLEQHISSVELSAVKASDAASSASGEADKAKTSASKALALADNASGISSRAISSADTASTAAGKATESAVNAQQLAANAEEGAIQANNNLNIVEKQIIDIGKAIRPRELFFKRYKDGSTNLDDLKRYAGTKVQMEYLDSDDTEPCQAAENLRSILKMAEWDVVEVRPTRDPATNPGVSVAPFVTHDPNVNLRSEGEAGEIADALEGWLLSNDWIEAEGGRDPNLPNLLRITVGRKPEPGLVSEEMRNNPAFKKNEDRLKAKVPHANLPMADTDRIIRSIQPCPAVREGTKNSN